jgi:undecaprenyl diphosphate synthase
VAVIMDGNGRWARARRLPRTAGHKRGVDSVRFIVEACASRGVEVLTLFAFSSENWSRPREEVSALMELFVTALGREVGRLAENGIRLRFAGERSAFPAPLQALIEDSEAKTRELSRMQLVIAAGYGGRWDIARAARELAIEAAAGRLDPGKIDEAALASRICLADLPEPDLFIRTGGEQRISNFLLWQLAYTELYFTDVLWPDFGEAEFERALACFARRQRRFGLTGEQLKALERA